MLDWKIGGKADTTSVRELKERYKRTEAMVETMDEYFGSCTNHGECEAACPKEISIDVFALANADYRKAKLKNRKFISRI